MFSAFEILLEEMPHQIVGPTTQRVTGGSSGKRQGGGPRTEWTLTTHKLQKVTKYPAVLSNEPKGRKKHPVLDMTSNC